MIDVLDRPLGFVNDLAVTLVGYAADSFQSASFQEALGHLYQSQLALTADDGVDEIRPGRLRGHQGRVPPSKNNR